MSTRSSRRSSGRDTFNPAMIHLLDADRLRKELENRGLDTTGNRSVLADRLQEAVDREKSSRHTYSPPPVLEKTASKRIGKRSFKAETKGVGQIEPTSAAISVKRKRLTASSNESVEVIEESFSIQISEDPDCSISTNRNIEDDSENVPVASEEASSDIHFDSKTEAIKLPPKKSLKKLNAVGKKRPEPDFFEEVESKESELQLTISAEKPFGIKIKKIELPVNEVRKESHIKTHIGSGTSRKKSNNHSEIFNDKGDNDKVSNSKDSGIESADDVNSKRYVKVDDEDVYEKVSNKEDLKQGKGLKLKLKLEHDKEPHFIATQERKELRKITEVNLRKSSDVSVEAVSEVGKRKLSKQGSFEKTKDPVVMSEIDKKIESEKKKDTTVRKKIPLRMQAVDVFDTIFDKQTELLSSKFKSEEERAAERQKIELAKRRQSSSQLPVAIPPPTPVERRRHTVEFNLSPQVFPSRNRLPPPPPPPLPSSNEVGFNIHKVSSTQRRLTPPPPPPLPKRRGVSFDEKPMSVILPAPPPPPVILPRLPPPPPPPLPEILPPFLDSSAPDDTLPRCNIGTSNSTHGSPSMPTTSSAVWDVSASSTLHSSYSSPAVLKSNYSNHSSSPLKGLIHSSLPSCSLSEPATSSIKPEDCGNQNPELERHPELPLQQIAKALCSVFAHIGSKSQGLENCSKPLESSPNKEVSRASQAFSAESNSESVSGDSTTVGELKKTSDELPEIDLVEVEQFLNDVIEKVVKIGERESSLNISETLLGNKSVDCVIKQDSSSANEVSDVTPVAAEIVENKEIGASCSPKENSSTVFEGEGTRNEEKPSICEALMRDPVWLLQKASDIIKNLESQKSVEAVTEERTRQYEQISPGPDYEAGGEEKPLPAFYGEPVPDDDDIFVEGAKRKSNLRKNIVQEEEPIPGDENVEIDFYNADLHIKASETNNFLIDPDNGDGFALMWGGARSNFGIEVPKNSVGFPKIVFQAKIKEFLPIIHLPFEELDPHDIRIGWSLGGTGNILGESSHSFAYSSLARKAVNSFFTDYGEPFHINDVITSVLDFERSEISYYKNEQFLGVAFPDLHLSPGDVVFPHICTKNCKVEVNFGDGEVASWLSLNTLKNENEESYTLKFMNGLDRKFLIRGPVAPPSKSDCTVLMMVGLPGVGKSTWVRQYLRDHPHEQWTLLSTDIIISAMKVNGIARSRVHQGRWDMIMGLTAKAMNRSLHLACRRRRNYIIDQTNVSREARRRKLSQFKDFQRKCVVIIPSEEEMLSRQARQVRVDGASATPVEAMLELKASFAIPNIENEPIEGVYFVEPPLERIGEAIELVNRFNEEARPWCQKRRGRRGESRNNGNGGEYGRSGEKSSNNYVQKNSTQISSDVTSPALNCDCAGNTPQSSAQPSPNILSRSNEGYCGFNGILPPFLNSTSEGNGVVQIPLMDPTVPPPNAWTEHKHSHA